jgi:hypothetical protein
VRRAASQEAAEEGVVRGGFRLPCALIAAQHAELLVHRRGAAGRAVVERGAAHEPPSLLAPCRLSALHVSAEARERWVAQLTQHASCALRVWWRWRSRTDTPRHAASSCRRHASSCRRHACQSCVRHACRSCRRHASSCRRHACQSCVRHASSCRRHASSCRRHACQSCVRHACRSCRRSSRAAAAARIVSSSLATSSSTRLLLHSTSSCVRHACRSCRRSRTAAARLLLDSRPRLLHRHRLRGPHVALRLRRRRLQRVVRRRWLGKRRIHIRRCR